MVEAPEAAARLMNRQQRRAQVGRVCLLIRRNNGGRVRERTCARWRQETAASQPSRGPKLSAGWCRCRAPHTRGHEPATAAVSAAAQ